MYINVVKTYNKPVRRKFTVNNNNKNNNNSEILYRTYKGKINLGLFQL